MKTVSQSFILELLFYWFVTNIMRSLHVFGEPPPSPGTITLTVYTSLWKHFSFSVVFYILCKNSWWSVDPNKRKVFNVGIQTKKRIVLRVPFLLKKENEIILYTMESVFLFIFLWKKKHYSNKHQCKQYISLLSPSFGKRNHCTKSFLFT